MSTFSDAIQTKPARSRLTRVSPHLRQPSGARSSMRCSRTASNRSALREDSPSVSLLDEARRRMKSNMQANMALLRLDPDGTEHTGTEAMLTEMENRLQSMAAVQKSLCRAGNFDAIDLAVYLRQAAILRNSPPHSPLPGGWIPEPSGNSLIWSRDDDGPDATPRDELTNLEAALAWVPEQWRDLARRAIYACAIVVPPWIFRWRSPLTGTVGALPLAQAGEVGIRLRPAEDGVVVELSLSDRGPGLPAMFDLKHQRALGMELVSVLARLVQGSLSEGSPSGAVFEVAFVPHHWDYTWPLIGMRDGRL